MATDQEIDEETAALPAPREQSEEQKAIVIQAKKDFRIAWDYESTAREYFDDDYKFANGDSYNMYQWDETTVTNREGRPCLTVNKTQQHNLMIVNDAKQNKPGVRIRPVGDEASYEAAQVYQEIVYHVEYISNAENVYDNGVSWAVQAGIGYWQVVTEPVSIDSFDQEIKIKRIKDPRSVLLDPNIVEVDGSDARWGMIFEDMPKSVFKETYSEYANVVGTYALGNIGTDDWSTKDNIRLCNYYRKEQKKDKLVAFMSTDGAQITKRVSKMDDTEKVIYKEVKRTAATKKLHQYRERTVLDDKITCYKIAGDFVVDEKEWLGKYIPIVRLPGTETVIDGVLDRKGHTRALIDPQKIYNANTSANVEYGALQTKAPWLVAAEQIGENTQYWETANTKNHAYLPYEHLDANGDPFPNPPIRPAAPQASPAYVEGLKIAQNEMMMASGQYQAQFGEAENAKSGVAINARQRQGDRATYHFIDNQAIAIRYTGKIIIDLIPKIYDTERVMRITGIDGTIMDVNIDPNASQAHLDMTDPNNPVMDKGKKVKQILFNPNIGMYDIQADTGPSFATKRMEAAAAMTQLATGDKTFIGNYGDFFFKALDFPNADQMAERAQKLLPPNVLGDNDPTNDPRVQDLMHKASDHIEKLTTELAETQRQLKDKTTDLTQKGMRLDLDYKKAGAQEVREDYKAETDRVTALGNSGPGISREQIEPVLRSLLAGMLQNGEIGPGITQGGQHIQLPPDPEKAAGEAGTEPEGPSEGEEQPPMAGAMRGKDAAGKPGWFVQHEGNHYQVGA